jgi:hypothetical protein
MTHARRISRVVSRLLILVATLMVATVAGAQSLALAPAEVRATFKGGQPVRFDVTVSNNGKTPVVMRATVMDLWYNEKNEKVFGVPGSQPRSASDWIEFVPRDFTVPAEGSGKVSVVVTPPVDASGGYYAVLFLESKPELVQAATAESRAIYASLRLGVLVLLSAAGTETYAIEVDEPRFTPPTANQHLALQFQLANRSNAHIFPQAKLAILNRVGRQLVARAEGEPKRFFPDQKDTLALSWNGTLPPGDYVAILTLVFGSDKVYTREFPFTVAGPAVYPRAMSRDP